MTVRVRVGIKILYEIWVGKQSQTISSVQYFILRVTEMSNSLPTDNYSAHILLMGKKN